LSLRNAAFAPCIRFLIPPPTAIRQLTRVG
jgi:hypothetical protein